MASSDRLPPQRLSDPDVPATSDGTVPYTDPLRDPAAERVVSNKADESSEPESHAESAGTEPREPRGDERPG